MGERARSRGTTRLEQKFPTSPQNKEDQTYTLFDIRANANNINLFTQNERRAHPNWAPTKEPKRELLEIYSNPKQDRFQDLLKAIFPTSCTQI